MSDDLCGCIKCVNSRRNTAMEEPGFSMLKWFPGPSSPGWRYACEVCGNKRCPHHSDHTLACTDSNETGQAGSIYA